MYPLLMALTLVFAPPDADSPGISRTVLKTSATMEAARVTYAPGAVEPPENHGNDVVLVPIDEDMTATLEGAAVSWTPGIPILLSRGAPHTLANRSNHPVRFVEVRTIGDNPAGNDQAVKADGATIVRSTVGKYIRATVWRFERAAHIEWPANVDAMFVHIFPNADGGVSVGVAVDVLVAEEIVRVSRMANP